MVVPDVLVAQLLVYARAHRGYVRRQVEGYRKVKAEPPKGLVSDLAVVEAVLAAAGRYVVA